MKKVLEVWYKSQYNMVGKVIPVVSIKDGREYNVFVHQESGSQAHQKLDSPGGYDVLTLEWLVAHKVRWIHRIINGNVWAASVKAVIEHGVFANYDERDRRYLPWAMWTKVGPLWYKPERVWVTDKEFLPPGMKVVHP